MKNWKEIIVIKRRRQTPSRQERERERERERESPMWGKMFSVTVWGTWWYGTSTKLLTFQFFYYCGTSKS